MKNKCVGIISNLKKDPKYVFSKKVALYLQDRGVDVFLDKEFFSHMKMQPFSELTSNNIHLVDFIVVIGGDGTILSAISFIGGSEKPVLGINFGKVGFLASVEKEDYIIYIDKALKGEYVLDKRIMLDVFDDKSQKIGKALNDIVCFRKKFDGVVDYNVFVDDEFLAHYHADGVIVAGPTGSTAYNLSSGGPIVSPSCDLMILNPICPHSLNNACMVISSEEVIKIAFNNEKTSIFIDGKEVSSKSFITIKKSKRVANFIRFEDYNFYSLLVKKIKLPSYERGGLS